MRSLARPLAVLAALGVLLRLAWVLAFPAGLYAESTWYFEQGVNLAQNKGYLYQGVPAAFWPVGYPFFLSLVFRIAGATPEAAQIANVLLLGLDLVLIGYLAFMASGSRGVALWTAGVMVFAPTHIMTASLLATEPLYAVLIHAQLLLTALALRRQRARLWLLCGVWAGLTAYVRPESLVLLGVVLLFYLLTHRPVLRVHSLTTAALIGAVAAFILIPWAARNWIQLGLLTPFSTNSCMNLWIGNNPNATGAYYWPNDPAVNPAILLPDDTEQSWYRRSCEAAISAIRHDPLAAVRLWPRKIYYLWENDENLVYWVFRSGYGAQWAEKMIGPAAVANVYYFAVLALGLAGISAWVLQVLQPGAGLHRAKDSMLVCAMLLTVLCALTLVYLPFFGSTRFHFALFPLLAFFGVRCVYRLLDRIRHENAIRA